MTLGERIQSRIDELGLNQTELARRVGVGQGTIAHLVSGRSRSSAHLHKIARELRTTAAYLSGDTNDPDENAYVPPTPAEIAAEMGLIKVEEIDLTIGMGAAFLDEHVTAIARWIPEDWVRNFTNSPAALLSIARPVGDSMYPTINDRDLVLIDRSQRIIDRVDGIWALVFGGFGTIKRVRVLPDGRHKLMADNPQVEAELATDGELFVIGRVAGVFRRT